MKVLLAPALVLALVGSGCAGPAPEQPLSAPVADALHVAVGPGVLGGLVRVEGPEGVRTGTAGRARADAPDPVEQDSVFRIGSITKAFVATTVLQLVAEHRLGLDDRVRDRLPGVLPAAYADVTVGHLLTLTSGVPNHLPRTQGSAEVVLRDRARDWTAPELVAVGVAQPPVSAPGAELHYSNTDYVLAGMVITAVTGRPWGDEVRDRIIGPLGLADTSVPGTDPTLPQPHPNGYLTQGDRLVDITEMSPTAADAAGAMLSSARDLTRFMQALLGGELLPPGLLDRMRLPSDRGSLLGVAGWGAGMMVVPLPEGCDGPAYGVGGGVSGYTGLVFGTGRGERRVAVGLNTTSNDPTGQTRPLLAIAAAALCERDPA